MQSYFEQEVQWNGEKWRLLYDPADPMAVVPNLATGVLRDSSCTEVTLPNVAKPLYLVILDIEIPAVMNGGEATPAKYIKGFRLYEQRPVSLNTVQTASLVYYIKHPVLTTGEQSAQSFLYTVLGSSLSQADRQAQAENSWSKTLVQGVVHEASSPAKDTVKRGAVTAVVPNGPAVAE